MPQRPCESIVETIRMLTQDVRTIDEQIHALEAESMNQPHLWRYIEMQRQVDRLIKKEHAHQDTWNRAMSELVICRSS